MKKVLTVLGPVDPDEIGVTLMHEHLVVDLSVNFVEPEEASLRALRHAPVTMELLSLLRRRPFSVTLDNVILGDEDVAVEEAGHFAREGGRTIVEVSNIGLSRDPLALARISRATGLHVVAGTGCYLENAHPPWVAEASVDELAALFAREVTVGIGETGIRAGIIGEIGTTGVPKGGWEKIGHLTPEEEKVLRAAGRAGVQTGAAVTVHLDLRGHGAFRIIDILEEEGLAPERMVMGHMDLVEDLDYHRAVVRRGVTVEFDCLGREYYTEELGGLSWGHDSWRVRFLAELVKEGFADRLVLSQDVCMKMDLRRYGGVGYAHVLRWIVPWLRREGVPEEAIRAMLVENPRRILALEWDEARAALAGRRAEALAA